MTSLKRDERDKLNEVRDELKGTRDKISIASVLKATAALL